MTIPSLQQHTKLSPKHLRHGLAVLIQQNLVYHHFDKDLRVTFYEANQDAIYFLLRFGKIIDAVNSRYGELARDVVQELLVLGSIKIGELANKFEPKQHNSVSESNGLEHENHSANGKVNGKNGYTHTPSHSQLEDVLYRLTEGGFIELVVESMFLSPSDTYNKVENELIREVYNGATKGTKQKDELRKKIRERLGEIRSDLQKGLLKRVANEGLNNVEAKRRKLANGVGTLNGENHGHRSENHKFDVGSSCL